MMTQPQLAQSTTASEQIGMIPNDLFLKDFQFNPGCSVLSTEYMSDDNFISLGCEDGAIRVLSTSNQKIPYTLLKDDKSPVTCLSGTMETSGVKNSLMATHTGGTLQFWHITSSQVLFSRKYETILQCCEVSPDGNWYVLGTQNGQMFVGHLNKGNPKSLETGHLGSHNNRVFCLKWHPSDQNIFLSGGWDKTVFFWDIRTKASVNKVFGSYMGGKAIDIKGNQVLLGNNENTNQIRIFDMKADKVRALKFEHYSPESAHSTTGINSCFFGKGNEQIITLTSRNQIRSYMGDTCVSVYDHPDPKCKGFSMSASKLKRKFVASWSTGDVKIMSY